MNAPTSMNRRALLTALGLAPVALVVGSAQAALPPQGRLTSKLHLRLTDRHEARRARLTALIDDPRFDFVWVKMPPRSGKTRLVWELAGEQVKQYRRAAILAPTWEYYFQARADHDNFPFTPHLLAATVQRGLRAASYQTIFVDDADMCGTCSEGDILALAQKRTQTFAAGKVIAFSTEDMPEWMAKRRHLALDFT